MSAGLENLDQQPKDSDKVQQSVEGAGAADDFEKTKPGKDNTVINNLGNPVFSCPTEVYNLPVTERQDEDWFQGYSTKKQNPMYMTSAMDYGSHRPTVHTMPTSFHAKVQKFSEHLGTCGMYRNQGLNTALDKSIV
ncbi:piercer of microtubule wall 1 protein-like isoform X1 [Porites lutea]